MDNEAPIVIAGAGPGGLILAYLLALNNIPVRVFERHKDFNRQFRGEFLQPSAMPILEELGILNELYQAESVIPVSAVRMHFRERVISSTECYAGEAAGFLVHQPTLLELIQKRCNELGCFRIDMQTAVTGFTQNFGRVNGVTVRSVGREENISSRLVVVCNGRMSSLRASLGLTAKNLEPGYTILWQRFDMSRHADLLPTSLEGFVGQRALCVVFPTHGTRLQIMWRRRPEYQLDAGTSQEVLNRALLEDLPPYWSRVVSKVITEQTEQQALKVVSDCLKQWWSPGALFIGDAAHSMSPIGGQGLAMAIRDAVVAANHIILTHCHGGPLSDSMCAAIQRERQPEIRGVQNFQKKAASLHVAPPMLQWAIAKGVIPMVTAIRGKSYMADLQHGFTKVRFNYF